MFGIPWWTIDNPQARGAAEPIPIPENLPFIPRLVPDTMPEADPTVQYPGQGAVALWNDVWHYSKSILSYFGRHGPSVAYITTDNLNQAIDDTLRASINSLSGFINQAAQLAVDAQNWAGMELDALSANIGAIYQYFDNRITALEHGAWAVERLALPSLQAQIDNLRHDMGLGFQYNSLADRGWAIDNIFRPLTDEIGNVARDIPIWSEGAYERAKGYTDQTVGALGLRTLTQLVPLTLAVKALQTESEQCTQPMCETIGPKTDLGKLLKGLQLAAGVALFAELANLDEAKLADLITSIGSKAAALVGEFETGFVQQGETIGGLIAREIAAAI